MKKAYIWGLAIASSPAQANSYLTQKIQLFLHHRVVCIATNENTGEIPNIYISNPWEKERSLSIRNGDRLIVDCIFRRDGDRMRKAYIWGLAIASCHAQANLYLIQKHWCLVFVAYSFLHLACLPPSLISGSEKVISHPIKTI